MSISSSMNAGVMGLAANANKLGVISDNIANSSTYGYKRTEADFHSMVLTGNNGTYTAGGVRPTTQRLIDERGPLIATSNSTDLAVRGRGMLPMTSETAVEVNNGDFPLLLSTTGSFRTDSEGYLKSDSGLVLMGWPALPDGSIPNYPRDTKAGMEPIQINRSQFAGERTSKIGLSVNLPATSTKAGSAGTAEILPIEYFDNLGTSESISIDFTPSVPALATDPPTNTWTMELSDSATPGAYIGRYELTFNDDVTNGGTLASVTPIDIDPLDPTAGTSPAYDATTGSIQVSVGGDPANTIDITIGQLNDRTGGFTQLAESYVPGDVAKDGSVPGQYIDVEIDANGFVHAIFDSGISRTIYQIPLVDMPNPNGLNSLDSQTYQITNESGSYFLWDAGDGPTGDIVSYAREESTVDVANELTELIQTQRAYSSNAKVIQTVDEMLQETTNIKR